MTDARPSERATIVAVSGLALADPFLELLQVVMPVRFVPGAQEPAGIGSVTLRVVATPTELSGTIATACLRTGTPTSSTSLRPQSVTFSSDRSTPFPFVGRSLETSIPSVCGYLTPIPDERVLASTSEGVLWATGGKEGQPTYRSGMPWPSVSPQTPFFQIFSGARFLDALPVIDFLKKYTVEARRPDPPLRAAFMIDDPNLHSMRYGFVDYSDVVRHATRYRYHMSFATIPLDTWYTHPGAARLFKEARSQVSLLVHGNNHLKNELAQVYSLAQRTNLLAQAIERMRRFSARTGVGFSPLMVPPHGACHDEVLRAMPAHGYLGACVSAGSLTHHNPEKPWTKLLGYRPYETIGACDVLPRWGLTSHVHATVLVAAYLGQAMIVMGHHQDMREGLDRFDRLADYINSLGTVTWADLQTLHALGRRGDPAADIRRVPPRYAEQEFGDVPFVAGLRRFATEGRDRFAPMYNRLFKDTRHVQP
jgi:hypothetical protein